MTRHRRPPLLYIQAKLTDTLRARAAQRQKGTLATGQQADVCERGPERAVEGFDHEVVDFVAKPFTEERLRAAIGRATAKLRQLPSRTIAVRVRTGWRYVRLSDIDHIRSADDYCELVLETGERLLHAASLEALVRTLPGVFRRVHRGVIVNLDRVTSLRRRPSGGYEVVTASNEPLPVGRSFVDALRTAHPGRDAPP